MNPSRESEFEEYLAGYVLGELSDEELTELGDLANSENVRVVKELETVAAIAALAAADSNEALPDRLRLAITSTGRKLASQRTASATLEPQAPSAATSDVVPGSKYRAVRTREAIAWLVCLAACVLAMFAWQRSVSDFVPSPTVQVSRQSLIATAPDLIQTDWADGKTPLQKKVTGDVVWSNAAQQGFMRFVGLPANDPNVEQYQLWIIDPSRDDEPIDGGVFNITAEGESIVPIQAKLKVGQPKAFAVTIEKPGGVVVSTQGRLPLLAMVP